jgi:hypothetical protein
MPRRILASKRQKVTEGWIQLPEEKLHNLYFSPTLVVEDEMDGICNTDVGEEKRMRSFRWKTYKT